MPNPGTHEVRLLQPQGVGPCMNTQQPAPVRTRGQVALAMID